MCMKSIVLFGEYLHNIPLSSTLLIYNLMINALLNLFYIKSELIFLIFIDMKDSFGPSLMNEHLCSSLKHLCVNEISIRDHCYIISMCINEGEEISIDIKVEDKETVDQWKSTFNVDGKDFHF